MGIFKSVRKNKMPYLVLFLLLAQTGFPFFFGDVYLGVFASFTAIVFLIRKETIDPVIIKVLGAFSGLMVLQILFVGGSNYLPFIALIIRLIYAYLVIRITGKDFGKIYVNILYVLTLVSFVLWALFAFVPGAFEFGTAISENVIMKFELYQDHLRNNLVFYTNARWLQSDFPRNAGPFWEPGAFGLFLVIGILFNTFYTKRLLEKKNIIFALAIFITFSFGAYVSFMLFLVCYSIFVDRMKNKYVLVLLVIIATAFGYGYSRVEFLEEKLLKREASVADRIDDRTNYENLNHQVGRNSKVRLDIRAFLQNPIIGEGQFKTYKFGNSPAGLSSLLRKWGVLGFLLFFGTMYKSFKLFAKRENLPSGMALLGVVTLMAVSLSQSIWGKPFFLGFIFMFLVVKEYKPSPKSNTV